MTTAAPIAGTRLRPLRWWDIEAAARLERELFPGEPWSAAAFWSELAGVPQRLYLAAVDGEDRLLGYAGLAFAPPDADVQTVAVAPVAQGLGLGRRLLTALLEEAAGRAVTQVFLEVREDNAAALSLYERSGFARVGRRRGYYDGGRTDAVLMRLRLPGPAAAPPAGAAAGPGGWHDPGRG